MEFFKRSDFACSCGCGFDTVDFELASLIDEARKHFNKPTTITSGSRCVKHNKDEGGAESSQHIFGKACDFRVKDIHADIVADYLETKYPNKYGIGRYKNRTHIDVRENKSRWDKR